MPETEQIQKLAKPVQCDGTIEKDWPGHSCVLSRRDCKKATRHPSGQCKHHRAFNWRPIDAEEMEMRHEWLKADQAKAKARRGY